MSGTSLQLPSLYIKPEETTTGNAEIINKAVGLALFIGTIGVIWWAYNRLADMINNESDNEEEPQNEIREPRDEVPYVGSIYYGPLDDID